MTSIEPISLAMMVSTQAFRADLIDRRVNDVMRLCYSHTVFFFKHMPDTLSAAAFLTFFAQFVSLVLPFCHSEDCRMAPSVL
jgi:ABC-type phosphate/phosphonate transport system permease subunit